MLRFNNKNDITHKATKVANNYLKKQNLKSFPQKSLLFGVAGLGFLWLILIFGGFF